MNILLDPNVAYLLLVGGIVLAILALFAPGTGLLELGALFALVLAGYSIVNLPVNAWAIVVLVLGVFPFLLALRRWRNWAFLAVSIAALIVGSVFMIRSTTGGPAVSPVLASIVSLLVVGFLWLVGRKSIEAMARPRASLNSLIGMVGETRTPVYKEGAVYVGGEQWTARSKTFIPTGTSVRVLSRDGLVLTVEPVYPPEGVEAPNLPS